MSISATAGRSNVPCSISINTKSKPALASIHGSAAVSTSLIMVP